MEFSTLFKKVKTGFSKADTSGIEGKLAFQFDLTGEGGGTFYAEVKDGVLSVEPYEYHDRDARFTLSTENFVKMMEGNLDAGAAYSTGELKIEGDIGKALKLKKLLGGD